MSGPRVLLMRLSIRESARGTEYLSGWLGAARIVAFKSKEPDRYGNPQWELYAQEPPPKDDTAAPTRNAERGQRTWDNARQAQREGFVEAWDQPLESTPFARDGDDR